MNEGYYPPIPDSEIGFVVPVLDYSRMARALGNSIKHFHPGSRLVVTTVGVPTVELERLVSDGPYDDLVSYEPVEIDHGGYSPAIWTKIQAIGLDLAPILAIMDADLMMYGRLDQQFGEYNASGRIYASILDGNPTLDRNFISSVPQLRALNTVPALCACLLLVRPNQTLSDALIELARQLEGQSRWPDQAILGLYAALHGGWHDLGKRAVIQCRDREILGEWPPRVPLVHVGSPRPRAFGASPRRWDEPTYIQANAEFTRLWGARFPEERLSSDLEHRLKQRWLD